MNVAKVSSNNTRKDRDHVAITAYLSHQKLDCIIPNGIILMILQYYHLKQAWYNNDKSIKLSNNDLDIDCDYDGPYNHLLRAEVGFTDGIHSFQIKINSWDWQGNGCNWIGFATKNASQKVNYSKICPSFWGVNLYALGPLWRQFDGYGKYLEIETSNKRMLAPGVLVTVTLNIDKKLMDIYHNDRKVAQLSEMIFEENELLYPCLYMGCYKNHSYTTIFDQ